MRQNRRENLPSASMAVIEGNLVCMENRRVNLNPPRHQGSRA